MRNIIDYTYELRHGEKWYGEGDDKVPEFIHFLNKAEQEVKINVGEINPENFERDKLIATLRFLLSRGIKIAIAFHKADNKVPAVDKLLRENPKLIRLKREFDSNLILYWQTYRAKVHFAVVDKKHIRLDTPHPPYAGKEAMYKYDTVLLAKRWSDLFDDLIKNCQEIRLGEIEERLRILSNEEAVTPLPSK